MNNSLNIHFDSRSLRRNAGLGPETGDIWVEVDGVPFPRSGWNDFAVVIVQALASAVGSVAAGDTNLKRVHFMEGPYLLSLRLELKMLVVVRFEASGRERGLVKIPMADLLERTIQVADRVVSACNALGALSDDAKRLTASLADLRSGPNTRRGLK